LTTLALAVIFLGALMLYCGIKGRSLQNALTGKSVLSSSGSLIQKPAGS
jgi:hypothetical protein